MVDFVVVDGKGEDEDDDDDVGVVVPASINDGDDDHQHDEQDTILHNIQVNNNTYSHHAHSGTARTILRYVPRCLRYGHHDHTTMQHPSTSTAMEATGISLDVLARAPISMASLFLGPALLQLAAGDAAMKCQQQQYQDCDDVRVYGFRPTSILTNIAVVGGLISSLILPFCGAIVDHTRYRRHVGQYTAYGLSFVKAVEIAVGKGTWFVVAWLQVVSMVLYTVHITASYAYVSDLSRDTKEQAKYNTHYYVVLFASCVVFLIAVISISTVSGVDDVGTARISQLITALWASPFFYLTWKYLLRDRPALRAVPHGQRLVMCGFYKVFDTASKIARQHQSRAIKWLLLAVMFGEAASAAIITVSTTVMADVLQMDATEIGLTIFIALITGIPGSLLGRWVANHLHHNPVASTIVCNTFFIIVTTGATLALKGPDDKTICYLCGALWGIALGWLSPMHTTAFVSIIQTGQETEMMGIYILATNCLSWLPPLIFTVLNENGVAMGFGLFSLNLYFFLAIVFCLCIGRYDLAVAANRNGGDPVYAHHQLSTTAPERISHANGGGSTELHVLGKEAVLT